MFAGAGVFMMEHPDRLRIIGGPGVPHRDRGVEKIARMGGGIWEIDADGLKVPLVPLARHVPLDEIRVTNRDGERLGTDEVAATIPNDHLNRVGSRSVKGEARRIHHLRCTAVDPPFRGAANGDFTGVDIRGDPLPYFNNALAESRHADWRG